MTGGAGAQPLYICGGGWGGASSSGGWAPHEGGRRWGKKRSRNAGLGRGTSIAVQVRHVRREAQPPGSFDLPVPRAAADASEDGEAARVPALAAAPGERPGAGGAGGEGGDGHRR